MNPFTQSEYSQDYLQIRSKLNKLPAYQNLDKFRDVYRDNQVIIVKAETGAGKGVIISPEIMMMENIVDGKLIDEPRKVVVTEPRTVNTEIATFIAKSIEAPGYVNFAYRFNNNLTDKTRLAFVTDGFLVNLFYNDPDLTDYPVVVVDEVHERNLSIDQILCFMKRAIKKDKTKKLVLLSATIDPKYYTEYFKGLKVATVEIPGRSFPVKSIHHPIEEDYVAQSIEVTKKICESGEPGDILCFLASGGELRKACKEIAKLPEEWGLVCYELYRGVPENIKEIIISEDQYREVNKGAKRKIVFSTNIAESGITINGIKFVIESGRRYEAKYDAKLGLNNLDRTFISKAEAEQRRGRAGRTAPGICHHLYPEKNEMPDQKDPEIAITNITSLMFSLLRTFKLTECKSFFEDMITPPNSHQIDRAIKLLTKLRLVKGNETTPLGKKCQNIPLEPQQSIALITANCMDVQRDVMLALACISIEAQIDKWFLDVGENKGLQRKKSQAIKKFNSNYGEPFSFIKILDNYLSTKDRSSWCYRNFIHQGTADKARRIFFKLHRILKTHDLSATCSVSGDTQRDKVVLSMAAGYGLQRATKEGKEYTMTDMGISAPIEPPNTMSSLSKHLLYLDSRIIEGTLKLGGIINLTENLMDKISYLI
jgi:HrpA-like RNA helicase